MSNIVGIDIGVNTIKIVSISKDDKGMILDTLGETKTPNGDWIKPEDKSKALEEVANTIKKLLTDLKSKAKQAVVCLPEDEIISRVVRLPPLKESEVKDVLRFEAETFVPYPLDKVSIDYEIVEKDDAGRLTLFVIASRNDLIQTYIKLFKMVGLELIALESPALAMRRVINLSVSSTGGIIAVDIGEKYSDIVSLNKGNIYLSRSLSVGGESFTRSISINLGLDMASSDEYKKAYGLKENQLEGKIRNSILPVFNSLTEEIRKTVAMFVEDQGKSVDLMVLSGGGANLPGLAEELTRLLGVEVQVMQPFVKIDKSKIQVPINLDTEGARFGLVIGLALRGLVQ